MAELEDLSNGFDPKKTEKYVNAVEAEQAAIDKIMEEAREACQPHKDQIKDVKNTAAEDGFTKKAFNALLAERRHLRKAEAVANSLNDGQKDDYIAMRHALGMLADSPLGKAVLGQAA